MTGEQWHETIDTNLNGVFYCCHAAIPHMRARGGGWIINISSLAGKNTFAGRRGLLRVEGRPQRVQRGADAGTALRRHPRQLRHAGFRETDFGGDSPDAGADWKLAPEDVAQVVIDLVAHPGPQPAEPRGDPAVAAREEEVA